MGAPRPSTPRPGEHGHRHEVDVGLALGHHAAAVGRVRLQVAAQGQVLISGAPARAGRELFWITLTIGSMGENQQSPGADLGKVL